MPCKASVHANMVPHKLPACQVTACSGVVLGADQMQVLCNQPKPDGMRMFLQMFGFGQLRMVY